MPGYDAGEVTFDSADLLRQMTMTVHVRNGVPVRLRMRLAVALIHLAALVLRCGYKEAPDAL